MSKQVNANSQAKLNSAYQSKIAKLQSQLQSKNNEFSKKTVVKKMKQAPNPGNTAFFNALNDPFDPLSLGCQVPDPFPFPTQVYHVHQTTVLGSSSGQTAGACMFLPNPVLSLIDLTSANLFNTSTVKSVQTTPFTQIAAYSTTTPGCAAYGAIPASNINSVFGDYRVVSWGLKISNLQPELSATGRLIIAYVPIGDTVPTLNDIVTGAGGATTGSVFTPICGTPTSVLGSSAILELPTAVEFTVGDLLHGDLELSGMYTNSAFWSFKTTLGVGSASGTEAMGDDLSLITASGLVGTIGYKDLTRSNGAAGIVIYFEGLPTSTTNAFQVESIYHLEGSPQIAASANTSLVPSITRKSSVGTSVGVEQAMTKASAIDKVVKFIGQGANFLNKNQKSLALAGKMASMCL